MGDDHSDNSLCSVPRVFAPTLSLDLGSDVLDDFDHFMDMLPNLCAPSLRVHVNEPRPTCVDNTSQPSVPTRSQTDTDRAIDRTKTSWLQGAIAKGKKYMLVDTAPASMSRQFLSHALWDADAYPRARSTAVCSYSRASGAEFQAEGS